MGVKTVTIYDRSNFLGRQTGSRSNEQVNRKPNNNRDSLDIRIDLGSTQGEYFTEKLERGFKAVGEGTCPNKELSERKS